MNSNVGDNNDELPPFASSSGLANSCQRLRDSADQEENIVPKRTVLTENSYNRQPFQPVTQSTPQNLGHYQPAFPLIPNLQAGFFENYGFANQWPNHTYTPYQPQLSTQQLANNALPMSSTPMQPTSFFRTKQRVRQRRLHGFFIDTSSNTARDEVFMKVPGRLALLHNSTKFDVTVGEVMRRTSAPENLGISLLGAVLRKAKEKGGYKQLSDQLRNKGIDLVSGRKRTLPPTTFTALCEGEAFKLAEDFGNAIGERLDSRWVRNELVKSFADGLSPRATEVLQLLDNFDQLTTKDQMAEAITDLMLATFGCLGGLLERDRSLLEMGYGNLVDFVDRNALPPELQKQLLELNLVTHNFGVKAMQAVFSALGAPKAPVPEVEGMEGFFYQRMSQILETEE
ncbi:Transcription factor AP-2-beta isoform X8 [Aphelenchoides besseyi]|nr:Transcription factor AP-2-beta isoform X8 [Aphelenchoides besseyi]